MQVYGSGQCTGRAGEHAMALMRACALTIIASGSGAPTKLVSSDKADR